MFIGYALAASYEIDETLLHENSRTILKPQIVCLQEKIV
jgi:hypothetical protein